MVLHDPGLAHEHRGKPSFSLLENVTAFIPVTFEFSVLCGAHGMAITYLLRNGTLPGMPASTRPRTTDDKFVVEITTDNNSMSADELEAAIRAPTCLNSASKTPEPCQSVGTLSPQLQP